VCELLEAGERGSFAAATSLLDAKQEAGVRRLAAEVWNRHQLQIKTEVERSQ
jgi:hypothetical protein